MSCRFTGLAQQAARVLEDERVGRGLAPINRAEGGHGRLGSATTVEIIISTSLSLITGEEHQLAERLFASGPTRRCGLTTHLAPVKSLLTSGVTETKRVLAIVIGLALWYATVQDGGHCQRRKMRGAA